MSLESDRSSGATYIERERHSKLYAWYVVFILFVAGLVSFLDRQVIALVVDDLKREFGLSDFEIGLLQGPPFGIFYAFMSAPIAILADRRSRRNIIAVGMTVWGLATSASAFAASAAQIFIARTLVGAGEAALVPCSHSMIADYFPRDKLSQPLAIFTVGAFAGIGTAMLLGGAVLGQLKEIGSVSLGYLGVFEPWQMLFLLVGLPSVAMVLLMATVAEPKRQGANSPDDASVKAFRKFLGSNKMAVSCIAACFALLTLTGYANFSWMIAFLMRTYGIAAADAAYRYGLVIMFAGSAGILFGGTWATWAAKRHGGLAPLRVTLFSCLPLAPLAVGVFCFSGTANQACYLLAVWQFFCGIPAGLGPSALMAITPNAMRAKMSALYTFLLNFVGVSLGAASVGALTSFAFQDDSMLRYSLAVVNAICGLGAVVAVALALRAYRGALLRSSGG